LLRSGRLSPERPETALENRGCAGLALDQTNMC
jgi:hypothetical protein